MSVRRQANNSAPTARIFMKFWQPNTFFPPENLSRKIPSFIKIGQELWVLYMKTNIHL
jgi:hypothetical protein